MSVLTASASCGDNHTPPDAPTDPVPGTATFHIDLASSDLGSVTFGSASPAATFTISNTGTRASGAITATLEGDTASFSLAHDDCTTLAAGASCQLSVVFAPASTGAKATLLRVSASPGGAVTASLTGQGVALGALSIAASANLLGSAVIGTLGTTTATFTVTNTGGAPTGAITVQPSGSNPSEFAISADTCTGQAVAAAASCTFVGTFSPSSVGAKAALFEVLAHPGGRVSGAVNGLGLAPARLVTRAIERNLGSVVVVPNLIQHNMLTPTTGVSILVTNIGDVASDPLVATLSGPGADSFALAGCDGLALAAKASCAVEVQLTPPTVGAKSAQLTIAGAPGTSVDAALAGFGISDDQLGIDPATASFSSTLLGEISTSQTVTIVNASSSPSGPLTTLLGGLRPSQFHTSADTCAGTSLAPGGQCTIAVDFRPSVGGPSSAELAVASTHAGIVTAGLFGEGNAAARLAIAPPRRGFGSVAIGLPTAAHAFTITNPGDEVSGALSVALVGADASQFAIADHDCTVLAPGASCSVHVQFVPTAMAAADASLEVIATPGGTVLTALAGDGVSAAQLVVIPSSFEFDGATMIGDTAAVRTFTVHNLGSSTTGALTVGTTGPDAADHAVTSDCTTLDARGVCTIATAFHPSAAGARDATITVAGTPGGTATLVVSGTARPRLEVIALSGGGVVDPFDFGEAVVHTTLPHDVLVTVRNNTASEQPLSVTASPELDVQDTTCNATETITADGGTCTARVRFTPTTVGPKTGAVTFAIGAGAANEAVQQLTGTGIESLTITPLTSASFGEVPRNTTSAARAFRVTNTYGSQLSGPIAIAIAGTGFAIVSDTCTSQALIASASCLVEVAFAATTNGAATGMLTATASPGGAPALELTANGGEPIGAIPTEITLAPSSVAENQAAATTVGVLGAVDADVADGFAFSLVAGTGGTNNASFAIVGNELRTVDVFDFELQSSYSIRVRVTDSGGQQLEQALAVAISNVDEPPTATADAFNVVEDGGATALDVRLNDLDADGGPMTISTTTDPANGTVDITGGGSGLTYQPGANFNGADTFTYTLDGGSTATVSITVTEVNDPPTAVGAITANLAEDAAPQTFAMLLLGSTTGPANESGQTLAIAAVQNVVGGTAAVVGTDVQFTPTPGFHGLAGFAFIVQDSGTTAGVADPRQSAAATVSFMITEVNDAPIGVADLLATVPVDSCVRAILGSALTANDDRGASDESAQAMTLVSVADAIGGTAILDGGDVEFTPTLGYTGLASFTYIARDNGTTNEVADFQSTQPTTVSFTIGVDDPPLAADDTVIVAHDSAATAVLVLVNDTDLGGDATIASATDPANGAVALSTDRLSLTYTPDPDYCNDPPGTALDTFSYTLAPGGDTGTVSVTVTCSSTGLCGNGTCGAGETEITCSDDCTPKSFDGLGFATTTGAGYPPRANGDVGPTHYVQAINDSIGIFRKTDGVRLAAFTVNAFMSQGHFGNACDASNTGNAVVIYDSFEDRWIITDVAYTVDGSNNINSPGAFQCIAASKTGDPVAGGWNFYSINTAGGLGSYPRFGIWPDGLYMSVNMLGYTAARTWLNSRVYAFNKAQMYAGASTLQSVAFDVSVLDADLVPSNARLQTGTPPPGSPNYFVSTWRFLGALTVYKLRVDWSGSSAATFTGPDIPAAATQWPSANVADAPSQGGNNLQVGEIRAMSNYYTNRAGAESLWTTHTVRRGDINGFAAPRWYEVNVTGGVVAANLPQAATWDPDAANVIHRFLPGLAVDRAGDLALGYTTSSSATKPAIKYAGRLASDPINTFSQTEQVVRQGLGTQLGSCGGVCTKWGDYSSVSLDRDGCTFWLTGEYYDANGLSYLTRIASFRFSQCTRIGDGGTLSGTVTRAATGAPISGAIVALGSRTATTNASGVYTFSRLPAGTYPSITARFAGHDASVATSVVVSDTATTTQDLALTAAATSACFADTSQAEFQTGGQTPTDLSKQPGNVILTNLGVERTDQISSPAALSTTNNLSATVWTGQTFRAGVTGNLTKLTVGLGLASGTSGTITVELRNVAGINPGTTVLATGTLGPVTNVGSAAEYTTTFATPAAVVSGTSYAIVLRTSVGSTVFGVRGSTAGGSSLANGQVFTTTNSGTLWTAVAADLWFTSYVTPPADYQNGNFVSAAKDANPAKDFVATWTTLSWTATTPANTTVQFQAAASNSTDGPFDFVGPDGSASTFFTTSNASLAQFNGFRYLKYKALLSTTDTAATPVLHDVTVCSGTTPRTCTSAH